MPPPVPEPKKSRRAGSPKPRSTIANVFRYLEEGFYVAIAVALAIAGGVLFVDSIVTFAGDLGDKAVSGITLDLLDTLLLVFIITELIHTVAAVIGDNTLKAEPFLIVGIVAAIRRLVVISAEAKNLVGKPEFTGVLIEMGILTTAVLLLGLTVLVLRRASGGHEGTAGESS